MEACDHNWIPVEWEYGNYVDNELYAEFVRGDIFTIKRLIRMKCSKCQRFGAIIYPHPVTNLVAQLHADHEQMISDLHKQDGVG